MKLLLPSKNYPFQHDEYNLRIFYDEGDNYYKICAYNSHKEEVARATFKFSTTPTRHVWLYKISTDEKYQGKGYATAVLYVMEYFALRNRFDQVEAKYYPENEHAKAFYDKYDYVIFKDGYETLLSKTLDFDFIKENVDPYLTEFVIEKMSSLER